jgi:hypothetical protein
MIIPVIPNTDPSVCAYDENVGVLPIIAWCLYLSNGNWAVRPITPNGEAEHWYRRSDMQMLKPNSEGQS